MANVSDNEIIQNAIKLVHEGIRVTFPVKGNSMLPFIIGGRESVDLVKPEPQYIEVGDIVLAWVNGSRYVVHRIISIEGDRVTLMGDGNIAGTETCQMSDIAAKAINYVTKSGKHRDLYTEPRMWAIRLWWRLLPVRRWILAIYRRTYLKILRN